MARPVDKSRQRSDLGQCVLSNPKAQHSDSRKIAVIASIVLSRQHWFDSAALAWLLLSLAGCGWTDDGAALTNRGIAMRGGKATRRAGESPVVVVAMNAESRTIRHAGGTATVPLKPRRIVTLNTTDAAFFLGVKPIAESASWEHYRNHYLGVYRKDVPHIGGAYGASMPVAEIVMTHHPDLIVTDTFGGVSLLNLQKVAPTLVMSSADVNVEQHLQDVGTALGISERTQAALRWLRYKRELAKKALWRTLKKRPADRMPVLTVFWPSQRMIRVLNHKLLYDDGFGFTCPEVVGRQMTSFVSSRLCVMDAEQMADIQADYLLYLSRGAQPVAPCKQELLETNPLWKHLPAVRNNRMWTCNLSQWVSQGPLAYSCCINDLVRLIVPEEKQSVELKRMLKDRPDDADIASVATWPSDRGMAKAGVQAKRRPPPPHQGDSLEQKHRKRGHAL
jgi:ABC-type Fe3+-hydroxamate transport system substrate-binding protein